MRTQELALRLLEKDASLGNKWLAGKLFPAPRAEGNKAVNAVDHPARILAPKEFECDAVFPGGVRLLKCDEHARTAVTAKTALPPENLCRHDAMKPIAALRTLADVIDSLGVRAGLVVCNG